MTTIDNPKKPNGQIVAAQNELSILFYLHRFGWLRTRDLADLVWRKSISNESAITMAQRTLKRLKDARQVLYRIAPDGATVFALSRAGAMRLGDEKGILARSGKDLLRELGNYAHRCNANDFAINQIFADKNIWTEREIQAGQAPIRTVMRKVPDGLMDITEEQNREFHLALAWVEVERGYKKARDFNKMMHFAFSVLGELDSQGRPLTEMYEAYEKNVSGMVNIGDVIIQIDTKSQQERIVNAVRDTKKSRPYDYGWVNVLHGLYLCFRQGADLYRMGDLLGELESDGT